MKANVTNLKKVLRICAKAHKTTFHDWSYEAQLGIHSDTPGTISDVQMILESFYGRSDMIEVEWGYVIVWMEDMMYRNKNDVDMRTLALALPYGTNL